ncbi:alkaline phosphatase family protein [uncultured Anaerococcus sp.]|uniref:alkaline phosphatase family protein n=1 Tax=uncultured Anaerococcus sp. TaxID=293428 RepID=UPI0025ED0835|nr:alkaline phosphatase family protein [uncultured Anaerococcus sp.]
MNNTPLIVISLDALGNCDEEVYKQLPFLKSMIEKGTWIKKVESVYPTLTYPIHSSVVTGRYPIEHGVDNNLLVQPEKKAMDWYWDHSYISGDTILNNAHNKGLKIAAFSWPVSAKADIEFNVPEVSPNPEGTFIDHLKENGSGEYIEELQSVFGPFDSHDSQKQKDEWMANATAYTFEKHQPDITFLHLIDVDHQKHVYGASHFAVKDAIKELDDRLSRMFEKISKVKNIDEINIMLLSDHSQIDTAYPIRLNKMLADMDLVNVNEDGTVKEDWQAYFLTCGGSTALYTKEDNPKLVEEIKEKIESLNLEGIDQIFSTEEIQELKSSDSAKLWLEAKEGYVFDSDARDFIENRNQEPGPRGNHGFLPSKEKNLAIAIFAGPAFKENSIIEDEKIVDIAPTIDKIYDLDMKDMSGSVIDCLK